MTGTQLATRLQEFGDIDASSAQVISWIDQCQREIATDAGKVVRTTISTITSGTEVALPADYAAPVTILVNNVDYPRANQVIYREDGYIVFPEDLTSAVLIYRRIPATYTALTTELEIHPLLHHAVLYFLIGMYYDQEGEGDSEESNLAQRYFNKFEYLKQKALARIGNLDSDGPVVTKDEMHKLSRYHHSTLPTEDKDGYV